MASSIPEPWATLGGGKEDPLDSRGRSKCTDEFQPSLRGPEKAWGTPKTRGRRGSRMCDIYPNIDSVA